MDKYKQGSIMTIILVICFMLLGGVSKQLDKNDVFIDEYIDLIYKLDAKVDEIECDSIINGLMLNQSENSETVAVIDDLMNQILKPNYQVRFLGLDKTVAWADPFELSKAYMLTISLEITSPNLDEPLNETFSIFIRTVQKDGQVGVSYMKWTRIENKKKDI